MKAEAPRFQPQRIEDYALIGDGLTGALVGRNGSIDWLCWPRFDSGACFAALLGNESHGRWLIAPSDDSHCTHRSYRGDTMVLETVLKTSEGEVAVIDFMPVGLGDSSVIRRIEGRSGKVAMTMHLALMFDFGSATPWLDFHQDGAVTFIVGPNQAVLRTSVAMQKCERTLVSNFDIDEGETIDFVLTWGQSHLAVPEPISAANAQSRTEAFWTEWASRCTYQGEWRPQVLRSLLTLKALIYAPTGGIVAAISTSLPEKIGGTRNWDYRYCWVRDSTLTMIALLGCGYTEEARAWRDWLRRTTAGKPEEGQIMYGVGGERCLMEWSPSWLPGYEGSLPVNVGNAAYKQLQLDIYGELIVTVHLARASGIPDAPDAWHRQVEIIEFLETIWQRTDAGIWEIRGEPKHFTHSKIMAWLAVDCSLRDAEHYGFEAPLEHWKALRQQMHEEICEKGFDAERKVFTQSYGSSALDANLLLIPRVGFLEPDDPRVTATVEAIEKELLVDGGVVLRYLTENGGDGLPAGEGAFLPCSFWLVMAYAHQGRHDDARKLFEHLLAFTNDVGLLSEEYDVVTKRQLGNMPQAFSHLAMVVAALTMDEKKTKQQ